MNQLQPAHFLPEGPQPLVYETMPALPYPVHALGDLREAVEAVQSQTQAPVAIAAGSALAIASLAVQGFADVETLGGCRPLSLYVLTVAQSGERKSTCDGILMAPLREHEQAEHDAYRAQVTSHKNAHAVWSAAHEQIMGDLKRSKGEKKAAAQADLEALGAEPIAPPSPDRTVFEPTFEGLIRKLTEGMPSLGLMSDEAGQFIGGFAMSKDNRLKTLAGLNKTWDGSPIQRTRAGDGSITLYGRRVAAHLMAQPGVAHAFLRDPIATDVGFLSRCLICQPSSTIGTRFHAKSRAKPMALAAWGTRLRAILATPMPMDPVTRALKPRRLQLSDQARRILVAFADQVELRQGPEGDLSEVTGAASKAAENAARIAGVLTLWTDFEAVEVAQKEMEAGVELARFYLSEAARLSNDAGRSPEIERAERLRVWLTERFQHSEVLLRDMQQSAPTRELRDGEVLRTVISLLEEYGWLVRLPAGTRVRGKNRKLAWQVIRH